MPAINAPSWFSADTITVSTAPTCGLTEGGRLLPRFDEHGQRVYVVAAQWAINAGSPHPG